MSFSRVGDIFGDGEIVVQEWIYWRDDFSILNNDELVYRI